MHNRQGFALFSTLVAIGLSGVVAAAAAKMFTNQRALLKMAESSDKRSAIVDFYRDMLHDDDVWQCTLNHKTGSNYTNSDLRDYVVDLKPLPPGGGVALIAPDCSTTLIEAAGRKLGKSITTADPNGWWTVALTWQGMGKGAVDLKLEVSIDINKYNTRHAAKLNQLMSNRIIKVHRSENATQGVSCRKPNYEEAVTSINLHTAASNRRINCSAGNYRIVKTDDTANSNCSLPNVIEDITAEGNVVCSSKVVVKPFALLLSMLP